jgi:hydroxymethylglutaryl-CoA lyase
LQVLLSLKTYGANKIIECPRDAMQGIKPFIPTERKVAYIQSLLRVGFDSIDFGSFVSPKIPNAGYGSGFSTTRLVSNNQ